MGMTFNSIKDYRYNDNFRNCHTIRVLSIPSRIILDSLKNFALDHTKLSIPSRIIEEDEEEIDMSELYTFNSIKDYQDSVLEI